MNRRIFAKLLILIGILCLLSGLSAVVRAAPPALPQAAPSPRPPAFGGQQEEEGGKKRSEPDIHSDVWGIVTDLSTGQPGQGMAVIINGAVVTTDSSGRFSLTGLPAGSYTIRLELPAGETPARPQWTVQLDGRSAVTMALEYYSKPAPAATPAATAPVTVLPQTGAASHSAPWLVAGLGMVICGLGISIFSTRKGKTPS